MSVLGSWTVRTIGLVRCFRTSPPSFSGLWWCGRARNKRQIYLFTRPYVALASLAKGPAGIALPGIVLIGLSRCWRARWKDLIFKLEIPRGT